MKRITTLFRVDSSYQKGSGHITRCITLAKYLQNRGVDIRFICNNEEGNINNLISKNFEVREIKNKDEYKEGSNVEIWPKRRQLQDAIQSIETIKTITGKIWVVVDNYSLDEIWERKVKEAFEADERRKISILVIDDLANRKHYADYLLDQNYVGENTKARYREWINKDCKEILGPQYAIIKEEFRIEKNKKQVKSKRKIINILVFFGGSDPYNLTTRCLEAFINLDIDNIMLNIVIGLQNKQYNYIKEQSKRIKGIKVHGLLPTLAKMMRKADIAIGSCGSTTWERAYMGLPSAVIAFGEDQKEIAKALYEAGIIHLIGNQEEVCAEKMEKGIKHCLQNLSEQRSGEELVDGLGCERIGTMMAGININKIKLREAKNKDIDLLLNWANEKDVRKNSKNQSKISRASHIEWFEKKKEAKNILQYIAICDGNCPLGQIRFDHNERNEVLIDISIDKIFRGNKIASRLIELGMEKAKKKLNSKIRFVAYIKQKNIGSRKSFVKSGFEIRGIGETEDLLRFEYRNK